MCIKEGSSHILLSPGNEQSGLRKAQEKVLPHQKASSEAIPNTLAIHGVFSRIVALYEGWLGC